jgi:hypothetical protein
MFIVPERARQNLTLNEIEAIAASLNMPPEDLLLAELRGTAA